MFILKACDQQLHETEDLYDNNKVPEFLNMLTGGTGGMYYPLGGEIAQIITDETGIKVSAISSNASADNLIAIQEGEAEIAMLQTGIMSDAVEGINVFEDHPIDHVLGLGSLYPETIQIVTIKQSGITSVEDLEGKKVSVGASGSGTYFNAKQILEIHGMTMDDIEAESLNFEESTGGMQDGNIDAAFITAGTPTGSVEGLAATDNVQIVPIEESKVDELIDKYPYYAHDTIEAEEYNMTEDVHTAAVLAMFAVVDHLPEEVVYDITKAIYENTDKLSHDKGKLVDINTALDGMTVDLHPGALKYYEEQDILKNN